VSHFPASSRKSGKTALADLDDTRSLHDRGFSLPLSKFGGFFSVRIHSSEPLPIFVKHCDLPVLVFSASVFAEFGAFPCGFGFGHGVNISVENGARKYPFGQ
jgi:hypothetical protein